MLRKNWLLTVGLALLVFIMVVSTKVIAKPHSLTGLYIFGDSLSDVGLVYQATGGIYPPKSNYFQGRYSNGRVWVEYLTDYLHLPTQKTHNFAYGGATTGNFDNSYVPSLLQQVQSFVQSNKQVNTDALYILWAGANDYLQGINNATIPVNNMVSSINLLTNVGAKNILVANLPNLGQLPATRTTTNSLNLSNLTQAHNQGLRRSLKLLTQENSHLKLATLDANNLYRDAITNPAEFGFSNVTSSCFSNSTTCTNPNQFLFWDGIHPTTAAHRIIAEAAFSTIQNAGIINSQSLLLPD